MSKSSSMLRLESWLYPAMIFGLGMILLSGLVAYIQSQFSFREEARFENLVQEQHARIEQQVKIYSTLLDAIRSLFNTYSGKIDYNTFVEFVSRLDMSEQYPAVSGVGYAPRVERAAFKDYEGETQNLYGRAMAVWPDINQDIAYPILYLEPQEGQNRKVLGYDIFSRKGRDGSTQSITPAHSLDANTPILLIQNSSSDGYSDFLLCFPVDYSVAQPAVDGRPAGGPAGYMGYVYAFFRSADFFGGTLPASISRQLGFAVYHNSDPVPEDLVFSSMTGNAFNAGPHSGLDYRIDIADQVWTIRYFPTLAFERSVPAYILSVVILTGFLLACAAAGVSWLLIRRKVAAEQAAAASLAVSKEKALLLDEANHRMKNLIAQVMAIARQSLEHTANLKEFEERFDGRLRALAATQDLLTSTDWFYADIRDVIRAELNAVSDGKVNGIHMNGSSIRLNDQQTLAIGLSVHELATNALKYGALSQDGGSISIDWQREAMAESDVLRFTWVESCPHPIQEPKSQGFGSKLINMMITRHLKGKLNVDFLKNGLKCQFIILVDPIGLDQPIEQV